MNVAMVEPVGGHGGNEFYDFGLCEFLSRQSVIVNLYTTDETRLDDEHQFSFGVKKYFKNIYGNSPKLWRGFRFVRGVMKSVMDAKRCGCVIAHFHIYHFSFVEMINVVVFKLFGFECVATVHDVKSFGDYELSTASSVGYKTRIILSICRRLIVHSEYALLSLVRVGGDEKKIRLVPHGDADFIYADRKISRDAARGRIGVALNRGIVLFFGQIKSVKGLEILLSAIPLLDKHIDVLVVGKVWNQDISTYKSLVTSLGVEDRVTFRSVFVPNNEVPYYFRASDVVCLPYKKIYSSGVVLRAMDYECAVIASDLPPLQAVVRDGETGLLFKSGEPGDLATKINMIGNDSNLRDRLAKQAKAFVDKNYAWPIVAKATKDVYAEIVRL